jgi:hypothetical protein
LRCFCVVVAEINLGGGSVAAREKQVEGVGKSSSDSLKITRCLSSPTCVANLEHTSMHSTHPTENANPDADWPRKKIDREKFSASQRPVEVRCRPPVTPEKHLRGVPPHLGTVLTPLSQLRSIVLCFQQHNERGTGRPLRSTHRG